MPNFLQDRHNHLVLRLLNDPDTRNWVREWVNEVGGNLECAGFTMRHLDLIHAGKGTELESLEEFACLWISGNTEIPNLAIQVSSRSGTHSFFDFLDKKDIPYAVYAAHLHYGEIPKAYFHRGLGTRPNKVHGFFHRKNFTEDEWALFVLAQENE